MAEHEEGFVLTTVDSIMNSLRRTVGAKAGSGGAGGQLGAQVRAVADDFRSGVLRDRDDGHGRRTF